MNLAPSSELRGERNLNRLSVLGVGNITPLSSGPNQKALPAVGLVVTETSMYSERIAGKCGLLNVASCSLSAGQSCLFFNLATSPWHKQSNPF
jgi:hypothetical protein